MESRSRLGAHARHSFLVTGCISNLFVSNRVYKRTEAAAGRNDRYKRSIITSVALTKAAAWSPFVSCISRAASAVMMAVIC